MLLQDLAIGSVVVDIGTTIFAQPILWLVVDKNHSGFPVNSVTLTSQYLLRVMSLDGAEPANTNPHRKSWGNQNYRLSNIRQWLNSASAEWYTPQHSVDTPPSDKHVNKNGNPYDASAGFLSTFSKDFIRSLLPTSVVYADPPMDGGAITALNDRVFLLSQTELSMGNANGNQEGAPIAFFSVLTNRKAYPTEACVTNNKANLSSLKLGTSYQYWLRSYDSVVELDSAVTTCDYDGTVWNHDAFNGGQGLRPCCNLPNDIGVVPSSIYSGAYELVFPQPAPSVFIRQNGAWKQAQGLYVRNGGVWKKATQVYSRQGVWKA